MSTITVRLKSGGSVRLVMHVNLFELSKEDREWVEGLVELAQAHPPEKDADAEAQR
jgi:hypothetical protein